MKNVKVLVILLIGSVTACENTSIDKECEFAPEGEININSINFTISSGYIDEMNVDKAEVVISADTTEILKGENAFRWMHFNESSVFETLILTEGNSISTYKLNFAEGIVLTNGGKYIIYYSGPNMENRKFGELSIQEYGPCIDFKEY